MLYTKKQVETMLSTFTKSRNDIPADFIHELMETLPSINLPENGEIMDAAYDETSCDDEYNGFIMGVEWVNSIIEGRVERLSAAY
jgi:hypothetical protein